MAALVYGCYISITDSGQGHMDLWQCITANWQKGSPNGLLTDRQGEGELGTPRPDLREACLLKQHHCWTPTLLKSLSLYTVCLPPGLQLPGRKWRGEGGCVECVGETRQPPTLHCVCGNPRQPHWFALQIVYFRNSYPLVGPFHTRNFHTRKTWSCFIS
jgi:hypothetical protein